MDCGPLISVIIPTYNRAQQTIAAIESVLAQTYGCVEIIVVDDGSTDGTRDAIETCAAQATDDSATIRYFCQTNQGPSVARNEGIARARGEYVAFLDSDDVWLPEKLERQVEAMGRFKNDCGACLTDTLLATDSGTEMTTFRLYGRRCEQEMGIISDAQISLAKAFCGFWISSLLVRASILKRIAGFDPSVPFAEDRDLYFGLSLVTSIAYVNMPLVRTDRRTSTHVAACRPWEKVEVQLRGQQRMLEKWLRMETHLSPDVRRAIGSNLRGVHSAWANLYLETGNYGDARRAIARAIKYEVTPGLTVKWALAWFAPTVARRLAPKSRPYL
jgi:glycosyltransferase involved in cell wall biosynthesis